MRAFASLLLLLTLLRGETAPAQAAETCSPELRLDHVVLAVHDLDAAEATYRKLGFSPKPGRPHPSGLRNLHLKIPYGGELELMSVGPPSPAGEPAGVPPEARRAGDGEQGIAEGYRRFLEGGEGGAYLALVSEDLDAVVRRLRDAGFAPRRWGAGGHEYVTFPEHPELAHLFFLGGRGTLPLPEDVPMGYLDHANGALTLDEVWLDGTPEGLGTLLEVLGARAAESADTYRVGCGRVVLTAPEDANARPRVRAVVLGGTHPFESGNADAAEKNEGDPYRIPAAEAHGIRLELPRRPVPDPNPCQ